MQNDIEKKEPAFDSSDVRFKNTKTCKSLNKNNHRKKHDNQQT